MFSNHWSRSNWILPLSLYRFKRMTNEFKAAAEQSFGTPCKMTITAQSKYADGKSFKRDYTNTNDITLGIWNQSHAFTVNLNPIDLSVKAGQSPWANAEFRKSGKIDFYVQPFDEKLPDQRTPYWLMRARNYLALAF